MIFIAGWEDWLFSNGSCPFKASSNLAPATTASKQGGGLWRASPKVARGPKRVAIAKAVSAEYRDSGVFLIPGAPLVLWMGAPEW